MQKLGRVKILKVGILELFLQYISVFILKMYKEYNALEKKLAPNGLFCFEEIPSREFDHCSSSMMNSSH